MHDAALHGPLGHRLLDRPGAADRVDGPHVQSVPALDAFARAGHPEGRAEDRGFEIVHRDRIAAQQRMTIAVFNEPDHVVARARVYERGSDHPEDPAAAHFFQAQQLRQDAVVHRPLARHFRRHKSEFVGTVGAAEKTLDMYEDPVGAILRRSDRDLVALAYAARLGDHQVVGKRGRRQALGSFTYVGRFVVEKKPSGRTPSAGAGVNRASGAPDNGGAVKLGGRY